MGSKKVDVLFDGESRKREISVLRSADGVSFADKGRVLFSADPVAISEAIMEACGNHPVIRRWLAARTKR